MWLDQQLAAGAFPNCRKAAIALEVSSRTIQRDIDFMRDRLARPIDYDDKRFGFYYYEKPQRLLPFPSAETLAYMALREQGHSLSSVEPPADAGQLQLL